MSRDDQRIREMIDRLVAMSPEPPPFPEEEVTLTTPSRSPRSRPALAFAGAALLVLLGASIPLLLSNLGEGSPVGTTPPPATVTPTVDTTEPTATTTPTDTTEPTQTTEPTTGVATFGTSVYLVQSPENSLTGNPALVPFWTEIEAPEDSSIDLLRLQLLTNDELVPPAPGFYNAIPAGVEIVSVSRKEQAILVEFNEAFRAGAGGLLADMTMLNQIVYTVTDSTNADLVRFFIDGNVVVDFGTDGLDLTGGLTRESFLDSLNSIIITSPVIWAGDGLPIVEGIANVFEATVSLDIVDANTGEVGYEDFTTATCGTGCWGEFSFSLETPAMGSDSLVRVYWSSPQDGSPVDVVYIPVAETEAWNLTP